MNPIILPIVQTRKLRLEKFNNLPEVIELVTESGSHLCLFCPKVLVLTTMLC